MGKTHINPFTKEQIELLRANHYVKSVSSNTVRFTEEFKKYFYQKYHSGMTARRIFMECDINLNILGSSRIEGFRYTLAKQTKRDSGFTDNRSSNYRRPSKSGEVTVEVQLKQLSMNLLIHARKLNFKKTASGRYGGAETMGVQAPAEVKIRPHI